MLIKITVINCLFAELIKPIQYLLLMNKKRLLYSEFNQFVALFFITFNLITSGFTSFGIASSGVASFGIATFGITSFGFNTFCIIVYRYI
jgi:hypothetical protein